MYCVIGNSTGNYIERKDCVNIMDTKYKKLLLFNVLQTNRSGTEILFYSIKAEDYTDWDTLVQLLKNYKRKSSGASSPLIHHSGFSEKDGKPFLHIHGYISIYDLLAIINANQPNYYRFLLNFTYNSSIVNINSLDKDCMNKYSIPNAKSYIFGTPLYKQVYSE